MRSFIKPVSQKWCMSFSEISTFIFTMCLDKNYALNSLHLKALFQPVHSSYRVVVNAYSYQSCQAKHKRQLLT